jgi:hypothetical protein
MADWTGANDTPGSGAVGVSNVFDLEPGAVTGTRWSQWCRACFPGRPIVGYEWGRSLTHALAAGFTTVGEHRVWFRWGVTRAPGG